MRTTQEWTSHWMRSIPALFAATLFWTASVVAAIGLFTLMMLVIMRVFCGLVWTGF